MQSNNNNLNHQEAANKTNLQEQPKLKRIKTRTTIVEHREDEDLVYEKIKNSRFKQQRLPAWRPVPTILSIIIIFSIFGIVFLVLGIVLLIYSNKVKSVELDYTDCGITQNCIRQINIDEKIDGPVFVYYQLNGFFQNSRRYVKSKNIDQLQGNEISDKEDCSPAVYNKDMDLGDKTAMDGSDLVPDAVAIPCGLMAKTFFNDTYSFSINGENLYVNEKDITFEKDRDLFKKNPSMNLQWIDLTDEHFLVWMRPSGLPNPKKLWGRIEKDLESGTKIDVTIESNYNVGIYEGKKKIILSNATKFGGKNKFLAVSYIVVGALSLICAIVFPIGYKIQQEKEKNE
jgi:preprotein translocase subunit SecG